MLEKEVGRFGIEPHLVITDERMLKFCRKQNFNDPDDLLASVGYGGTSLVPLVKKMVCDYRAEQGEPADAVLEVPLEESLPSSHMQGGVKISGLPDALVRFSRCCNPVPGDQIIGYVTRGRGVSIHTTDCPNTKALRQEPERLIDVYWDEEVEATYQARIEVIGLDRPELLRDILQLLAEAKVDISSLQARTRSNRTAAVTFTATVKDREHLHAILEDLTGIRDVFTAQRVAAPGVQ